MHDIIDIIKNIQTLSENNSAFKTLKDFERVLDELNLYVYENWLDGELLYGPEVNRYSVKCTFMWPRDKAPDPDGGKILLNYGCDVIYKKEAILMPRKIKDPGDFRPGTKKGKIDAYPVWTVDITMPKKLMQDIYIGKENRENNRMAELMRYSPQEVTQDAATQQQPVEGEPDAVQA